MCTLYRLMWPEGQETNAAVGGEWETSSAIIPNIHVNSCFSVSFQIAVCLTVIHYNKYSCIVCIMPLCTILYVMKEEKWVSQVCCLPVYTGHFIMFSVITNIYNKKTKGPTLGKNFFFVTTSILYSCSCHTCINMYRCVPCHPWCTHQTSLVVKKKKKNFFSLPVAVNNSIKVGPLVFLL